MKAGLIGDSEDSLSGRGVMVTNHFDKLRMSAVCTCRKDRDALATPIGNGTRRDRAMALVFLAKRAH